ncbi:hypothetical protein [Enterobacter roggenkampii]|uniref:hypothetical protein n=1 Tax=Enterobacter roggenkampii TaxID=1812935 RepID=UPI001FD76DE1|nr:hypothetical protein [Enterobacter roggenkampii]
MDIELGGRVGIFTAEYRQYQEIYDKLEEILLPLKKSFSRREAPAVEERRKIDFWVTNDNKLAGRGREYEIILIDEAAFTKSPEMLREIWPKSIKPTLLTTKGRAYVFSTPDGWTKRTSSMPSATTRISIHRASRADIIQPVRSAGRTGEGEGQQRPARVPPEFLAEFVDWSAASLFDVRKWFEGENQISLSITLKCASRLCCHGYRCQGWFRT